MNKTEIKSIQRRVGVDDDGFWGPRSIAACQKHLRALMPSPSPWPSAKVAAPPMPLAPDHYKLIAFFGQLGDESSLTNLSVEGLGVRYGGSAVRTIRCNIRVASSLRLVLEELSADFPEVLADYDGCYNLRKMRGGSNWSLHAWGAAIDFCASANGLKAAWPVTATMPFGVMEAFARRGWLSAGAFWGRDAMHFQATR